MPVPLSILDPVLVDEAALEAPEARVDTTDEVRSLDHVVCTLVGGVDRGGEVIPEGDGFAMVVVFGRHNGIERLLALGGKWLLGAKDALDPVPSTSPRTLSASVALPGFVFLVVGTVGVMMGLGSVGESFAQGFLGFHFSVIEVMT